MYTAEQMAALQFFIFRAKNGSDLTKRIMSFLIRHSNMLTEEVCMTLVENQDGFTRNEIQTAAEGCHGMKSSHGSTHLNEIMVLLGTHMHFDYHYGDYDPTRADDPFNTDGMFPDMPIDKVVGANENPNLVKKGMPLRYTFWLCRRPYSRSAKLVSASAEVLSLIDLKKPGLYPDLEARGYFS